MNITIEDVANHFRCDTHSAFKIAKLLSSSTDTSMIVPDIADFTFAGVRYSLLRTQDEWVLVRSTTVRSANLEDII